MDTSTSVGFGRLLLAGLVGTSIMSLVLFVPEAAGWRPGTDLATLLGSMSTGGRATSMLWADWWTGLALHYAAGCVVFPLLFTVVADRLLPGGRWARGLVFSLVLWLTMEAVVLPLFGFGIFASRLARPVTFDLIYLLAHVGYGVALGILGGRRRAHAAAPPRAATVRAPLWSISALTNPLDQLIGTAELVAGGVYLVIGAGLLALGPPFGAMLFAIGAGILAITLVAQWRGRRR